MPSAASAPVRTRPAAAAMVTVPLVQLRVGAVLHAPIYDARGENGPLLLSAGSTLTVSNIRSLERRGISQVRVFAHELERVTADSGVAAPLSPHQRASLRLEASDLERQPAPRRSAGGNWRCDQESFLNEVQLPSNPERNPELAESFQQTYTDLVQTTNALQQEFVDHGRVDPQVLAGITDEHLRQIARDLDEFLVRSLQPIRSDYPGRHSLQTAMLASCIGTTMGFHKDDLADLNAGCLLHDAGMLLVPQHLRLRDSLRDAADILEVQKHPVYVADRLAKCGHVSYAAKLVVYQMHERMNGSGYPRQRQGGQIHPLARVAAVADTFLSMISPHSDRSGLEPYRAVEKLLYATRQGLFDSSAVRALLYTVSLFPIGSLVQLSDGRSGRVIRGNREHFARPVVELLDPSDRTVTETVDLAKAPDLSVVAAGAELLHAAADSDE